ncbi:MAG TPA: glycosyltransferase family 4 protein [Bryobacteraceae bacterium]|nr:glycosyltransferase family 4 protein [Bryobacteraceae bacterium]
MRLLIAHNFYQQPGGEDEVFAAEVALLERFGHEVRKFEADNDAIDSMGKLAALKATIWNKNSYRAMRQAVREHRAQVVHFHNTFPLISPAAYQAAHDEGAAVVQTLHNFRLLCPSAVFFREGKVCEDCLGKRFAWPGIVHKCYRGSTAASAAVAAMSSIHRMKGTWHNAVDLYLAPTEFARQKFIEGGFPADRIVVKPNFLDPDPGIGAGDGGYAIFVGRLSHEKGLETLIQAWARLAEVPLKIVGDGPLAPMVQLVALTRGIEWLGRQPAQRVLELIGAATALIFPSRCYETFGRVAVEAFARGTPVIASNHGAMADVVRHDQTGLLFSPGNSGALVHAIRTLHSDAKMQMRMRHAARAEYEQKYTGAANHAMLINAYNQAIARMSPATTAFPSIPTASTALVEQK